MILCAPCTPLGHNAYSRVEEEKGYQCCPFEFQGRKMSSPLRVSLLSNLLIPGSIIKVLDITGLNNASVCSLAEWEELAVIRAEVRLNPCRPEQNRRLCDDNKGPSRQEWKKQMLLPFSQSHPYYITSLPHTHQARTKPWQGCACRLQWLQPALDPGQIFKCI